MEGLFDYAVLWQAGFHNVTCSLGNHLNARQFQQLCDGSRTVYLTFDADANGSGQRRRNRCRGVSGLKVYTRDVFRCRKGRIQTASSSRAAMHNSFSFCWRPLGHEVPCRSRACTNPAQSPYRVVEQTTGREIDWINRYLDYESLRRVSRNTLRSYAHELLHFLRWWEGVHHTDEIAEGALTESTLLDYVRFQSGQEPQVSAPPSTSVLP